MYDYSQNHYYQIKSNEWETVSGERFCSGLDSRKPARHMVTRHDMIMTIMMMQYILLVHSKSFFSEKVIMDLARMNGAAIFYSWLMKSSYH